MSGKTNTPRKDGTTSEMVDRILSTWNGEVKALTPEQYSAVLKLVVDDPSTLTPSQKDFVVEANLNLAKRNGLAWLEQNKGRLRDELELLKNDL